MEASSTPGTPFLVKAGRGMIRRVDRCGSPGVPRNRSSSSLDMGGSVVMQSPGTRSNASNGESLGHSSFRGSGRTPGLPKVSAITQRREKEGAQRTCANLATLLGVAVMVESLGVAIGGTSQGPQGFVSTLRTGGAALVFLSCFPLLYFLQRLPTELPDALILSTALYIMGIASRLTGDTQVLMRAWAFPVLPKLSAPYCQIRRGAVSRGEAAGVSECAWQRDGLVYFRVKEVAAVLGGVLYGAAFVAAVAMVFGRSLGWGVRERLSFRVVVAGLCCVLAETALCEGFVLPAHTVQGISTTRSQAYDESSPTIDAAEMRNKLALAAAGAAVEAVAALWVAAALRACPTPSSRSITAACLFLSLGMLMRLVGEVEQLHPAAVWPPLGVDTPLTIEMAAKILADMLFGLAALCFSAVCLQRRYCMPAEDFGVT